MGLLEKGIKDYTTCLKYNPTDGKVWYYKARALALAGKTTEKGVWIFVELFKLIPKHLQSNDVQTRQKNK